MGIDYSKGFDVLSNNGKEVVASFSSYEEAWRYVHANGGIVRYWGETTPKAGE